MQEVKFMFYKTNPSPQNVGLKLVLWEVIIPDEGGVGIQYDWGFGNWNGQSWDPIEMPEGVTAQVGRWANTVNPVVLMSSLILGAGG